MPALEPEVAKVRMRVLPACVRACVRARVRARARALRMDVKQKDPIVAST